MKRTGSWTWTLRQRWPRSFAAYPVSERKFIQRFCALHRTYWVLKKRDLILERCCSLPRWQRKLPSFSGRRSRIPSRFVAKFLVFLFRIRHQIKVLPLLFKISKVTPILRHLLVWKKYRLHGVKYVLHLLFIYLVMVFTYSVECGPSSWFLYMILD